jgi:hypothetical protein
MMHTMRRLLCAAVFVASLVGAVVVPAAADPIPNRITLSFDYSDNNAPASVSNGTFNVIVNVLPENTTGLIRMVAVAPADSNASNLVCRYQWINQSQAECAFNFPDNGIWAIHAQFAVVPQSDVVASAVTKLRVNN